MAKKKKTKKFDVQVLKDNLGKPLTNIPDPFKKFSSSIIDDITVLKLFLLSRSSVTFCMVVCNLKFN